MLIALLLTSCRPAGPCAPVDALKIGVAPAVDVSDAQQQDLHDVTARMSDWLGGDLGCVEQVEVTALDPGTDPGGRPVEVDKEGRQLRLGWQADTAVSDLVHGICHAALEGRDVDAGGGWTDRFAGLELPACSDCGDDSDLLYLEALAEACTLTAERGAWLSLDVAETCGGDAEWAQPILELLQPDPSADGPIVGAAQLTRRSASYDLSGVVVDATVPPTVADGWLSLLGSLQGQPVLWRAQLSSGQTTVVDLPSARHAQRLLLADPQGAGAVVELEEGVLSRVLRVDGDGRWTRWPMPALPVQALRGGVADDRVVFVMTAPNDDDRVQLLEIDQQGQIRLQQRLGGDGFAGTGSVQQLWWQDGHWSTAQYMPTDHQSDRWALLERDASDGWRPTQVAPTLWPIQSFGLLADGQAMVTTSYGDGTATLVRHPGLGAWLVADADCNDPLTSVSADGFTDPQLGLVQPRGATDGAYQVDFVSW